MSDLRRGDEVLVHDTYRAKGAPGGWKWQWRPGRVEQVNRVTVDVSIASLNGGWIGPFRLDKKRVKRP